jgi:hypothetical protein
VERLKVKIAQRIWQMGRQEFRGLLTVAAEQVPFGIYAVEKKNYAELLNQKCESKRQLKQMKRAWQMQGFKVYANGL